MNPTEVIRSRLKTSTLSRLAGELGVSISYLNDVAKGRKEAGKLILDAIGVEKVVTYRKKRNAP
jgi:hypothetical protein